MAWLSHNTELISLSVARARRTLDFALPVSFRFHICFLFDVRSPRTTKQYLLLSFLAGHFLGLCWNAVGRGLYTTRCSALAVRPLLCFPSSSSAALFYPHVSCSNREALYRVPGDLTLPRHGKGMVMRVLLRPCLQHLIANGRKARCPR